MMKIFLIRHGETTGDIEDRYGGSYDDHLSDKGKEQCRNLSEEFKGMGIEIVYHSPLIRAAESAGILARALLVRMQKVDDIRERNYYGVLSGLTREESKQRFPQEVAKMERGRAQPQGYRVRGL